MRRNRAAAANAEPWVNAEAGRPQFFQPVTVSTSACMHSILA